MLKVSFRWEKVGFHTVHSTQNNGQITSVAKTRQMFAKWQKKTNKPLIKLNEKPIKSLRHIGLHGHVMQEKYNN